MMRIQPSQGGWIEVICGPMFCGKSDELIRRADRAIIAGQRVRVFKPAIDDRYHATSVASHAGATIEAELLRTSLDLRRICDEIAPRSSDIITADVVAIDEAQFLESNIVATAEELADAGVRVILAGLDQDFLRRPFGSMSDLLVRAEFVDKLQAVCMGCKGAAFHTQRLLADGSPASSQDPLVVVGAADSYEARCRACHVIP